MKVGEATRFEVSGKDMRAARIDGLVDAAGRRCIALVAPPGYGKSAMLARLRRRAVTQEHRVILLNGADLSGVSDIAAAMRDHDADPPSGDPAQSPVEQLDRLLAPAGEPITILIDDADRLAPDVAALFDAYLSDQRTECRIVLAGRTLPAALRGGHHSAYGRLRILGADVLAFRQIETLDVLTPGHGDDGSLREAVDAAAYADGWPVAVDMALALHEDRGHLAQAGVGRLALPIATWLDEHVYPDLSDADRELLHGISLLADDVLDPALVAATCDIENAAAALAAIADATPFVRAGRAGRYRLRPFAKAYLERRPAASPGDSRRQHLRAARFLQARHEPSRAITHAIAAQRIDLTKDWMAQALRDAVGRGNMAEAVTWLQTLSPRDQPLRDIDTIVWAIWALAVGGFADRARLWLIESPQPGQRPMLSDHDRAIVETLLASIDDDVDRGIAHLAPFLDAGDVGLAPPMAGLRANCLRWINQQVGSGMADPIAPPDGLVQTVEPQDVYRHCMAAFRYANVLLNRGRSHEALRFLEPAHVIAEKQGGLGSMPLQIVSSALAAARRQHGDVGAARLAAATCGRDAARLAIPDVLWLTQSTAARLVADEGDWPEALNILSMLEEEARVRALPRLIALGLADRVRILIRAGQHRNLDTPLAHLREVHDAAGALGPVQGRLVRLAASIGIAHAARALGQDAVAAAALDEARHLGAAHRRSYDLAEIALLSVDPAPFERDAMAIDEPDRRGLMRDLGQSSDEPALAIAMQPPTHVPVLTAKETEIIELLSAGLSNKRIAAAMLVSVETVKWHLKNIFNKLDVHDREHVIAYARKFVL